jgi:hypothetical protein
MVTVCINVYAIMNDRQSAEVQNTVQNFCGNWCYPIPEKYFAFADICFVLYCIITRKTFLDECLLALYTFAAGCQHIFNRCLMII